MTSSGLLRRVVLTSATRRNIPEDAILHSHRRENLKSCCLQLASTSFESLALPLKFLEDQLVSTKSKSQNIKIEHQTKYH
jgi:hypothetical protein